MKKLIICSLVALCSWHTARCQFGKIKDKIKDRVEQRVDNRENRAIDKGLDKTENKIDNAAKAGSAGNADNSSGSATPIAKSSTAGSTATPASVKAYKNYDFVPGDRIVFEDHFTDDQDGEFPSHWSLNAGQAVLNKIGDNEALLITDGNSGRVSPLIKGNTYLADTFTIEFDSYTTGGYGPHLFFYSNTADAKTGSNYLAEVNICVGNIWEGVSVSNKDNSVQLTGNYPAELRESAYKGKWHHVAIANVNHQVKVYVDQFRILTVPNLSVSPRAMDIEGIGDAQTPIIMANFRIANGGSMNMYGKKFTDAKIVTHGINFDVDKATIKPESMGTLNMIVKIMTDNPDIKFEVDGHTDNSGAAAHNLTLSQQRADAVKAQLAVMGIDAARLTAKGLGDTKPVSSNTTIEGKANNRRVEFIKK